MSGTTGPTDLDGFSEFDYQREAYERAHNEDLDDEESD